MKLPRIALVLALALIAGGCSTIQQFQRLGDQLESATVPVSLYVLSPKSTFPADLPDVRRQLVVEEPTAASSVNTDRIAVKPGPFQVEYFPEARWPDRAPLLVQRLLVESFENTGKITSVSQQAIGLAADFILFTDLREFQAETTPEPGDAVTVNVQLNVKVVEARDGFIIASKSFANKAVTTSEEMIAIVTAFDAALNQTMRDAVDFTMRQIATFEATSRAFGVDTNLGPEEPLPDEPPLPQG